MADTYKCEQCGGTFDKGRSDVEAMAEYEKRFRHLPAEERIRPARVCAVCYRRITAGRD